MGRSMLLAASLVLLTTSFNCDILGPHKGGGADTTSNNFTFQTFTFGASNAGGGSFQDVAIISDTDIWAVGAVYLDSASGAPDPFPYNAAHWDGKDWTLRRIYSYTICGQQDTTPYPMSCIFAFTSSDIWFSDGGEMIHWTATGYIRDCSISSLINGGVNRIWGTSSSSLYVAGGGGTILRYASGTWTKLNSGTTLTFYDIYGSGGQVLAVASDIVMNTGVKIVQISGSNVTTISNNPITVPLMGVWFVPNQHYYVVGNGIYEKRSLSDTLWGNSPTQITRYGVTRVRGTGMNDVYVVGAYGEFLHYNGARWVSFADQTGLANGSYTSVAVKGDLVVAVGGNGTSAVITIGKRN